MVRQCKRQRTIYQEASQQKAEQIIVAILNYTYKYEFERTKTVEVFFPLEILFNDVFFLLLLVVFSRWHTKNVRQIRTHDKKVSPVIYSATNFWFLVCYVLFFYCCCVKFQKSGKKGHSHKIEPAKKSIQKKIYRIYFFSNEKTHKWDGITFKMNKNLFNGQAFFRSVEYTMPIIIERCSRIEMKFKQISFGIQQTK